MAHSTSSSNDMSRLFDWVEYAVFIGSLLLNIVIGVYFGFIRKEGQDTVEGYMLGGKQMQLVPVSLSLVASFISGITLLGVPAEVYEYGTQILGASIAMCINGVITAACFLPIFYKLQLLSLYEYLERRFDRRIRKTASGLYIFTTLIWVALAVYVPALAMNQVTGLSVHLITSVASAVCIFYTTVGGLKAVVWADAIQTGLMVAAFLVIMVVGTIEAGGLNRVLEVSREGERMEIFNMDPSLTTRMSFWSSSIGFTVFWVYATSTSSAMVQRFLSLPTRKLALQSVFWYVLGCSFFFVCAGYVGLLMYNKYKGCDPISAGLAQKSEQVTPLYVLAVVGHLRGVPGLFLSGVFAAALSTMATCINAVAAIVYEDFIVPGMKKRPSDSTASWYLKWISLGIGMVTVALVFLVEKLGAVLEISSMFGGAVAGIMVAIFVLAIFCPFANVTGVFWGFGVSIIYMAWTIIGFNYYSKRGIINYQKKPLSLEECQFNVTRISITKSIDEAPYVLPIYYLSVFWYSVVSFVMTLIVVVVASKMSGGRKSTTAEKDLFHPLVHGLLIRTIDHDDHKGYVGVPIQELLP